MRETQATIWQWRIDTFGQPLSLFRVITRANEELAELLRKIAVGTHTPAEIAEEAADVAIVLFGVAEMSGIAISERFATARVVAPADVCAIAAFNAMASLLHCMQHGFPIRSPLRLLFENLTFLCQSIDQDFGAAIDAKMATNRAREWKLDGTGHGYHVREKAGA